MVSEWLFICFQNKFYLLFTDTDCQGKEVCNENIEITFCVKLLGIKINTKLKFEEHVKHCVKTLVRK